ncbi:MAG: diaminobutyrate--2-oxoglutarate transaminase [Hyphomicrobiaceae bacterium]|nr:diaminobutyrate--2-oxoglutarate transaminase [Hyphomicrobiaceae bacterium]
MKPEATFPQLQSEFDRSESGVRYYCRHMPAVFSRARNARVWDETGRAYIDFLSACGSLNYGHNHPALKSRLLEYLSCDGVLASLDLHTSTKREFLTAFRELILAPRGLDYRIQFTGPTGTNAVEAALKLARKVTGRRTVVAFTNAFHGMTLGSMSVSGRRGEPSSGHILPDGVTRLPYEGYFGAGIAELDRYAAMVDDPTGGEEPPAAIILETVQGEGGLNVASEHWLRHVAILAEKLGALLIVDDIQAGCGRTGSFFSFERAGIAPDIVCLSKSLSGTGLPLSVLLIAPQHDKWLPGEHNGTFRGNNLAFASASAAFGFWRDKEFLSAVRKSSQYIRAWLSNTSEKFGPVTLKPKGTGFMCGLEFARADIAERVCRECQARDVLIETSGPSGEVVKVMPPLTIEPELLEEGLGRLDEAIVSVLLNSPDVGEPVAA